jgi:regulatory protein
MVGKRPSLKARALSFLARREHSRAELVRKLTPHTEDPSEIGPILDDFEARGWLSEMRFVEQSLHRLVPRYGRHRIAQTLRDKGVSETSIAASVAYLKDNEPTSAREILKRKYSGPPTTREERAKRARFLQSRGFDHDTIRRVIDQQDDDT